MKLWNAPEMNELDVNMTLGGSDPDVTEGMLLNMMSFLGKDLIKSRWDDAEIDPTVVEPS